VSSHKIASFVVSLTIVTVITFFPSKAPASFLLVSSAGNDQVLAYNQDGTFAGTFASGNGLDSPLDVVFGPDGNFYVTSFNTNSILRYNGQTGAFMNTFATNLNGPHAAIFGPDGNLYVASIFSASILRFNGVTGASIGTFVPNGSGGLFEPRTMIFGPDGNLYVGSGNSPSTFNILRYNGQTGAFMGVFASGGGLLGPRSLAFGPDGNLYVASAGGDSVLRYNGQTGAFMGAFVPQGSGGLDGPAGIGFGPDGVLYVSSNVNDCILKYNGTTGAFIGILGGACGIGGLDSPKLLTFFPNAPAAVPEPSTLVLLGSGIAGLLMANRRSPGRRREPKAGAV